MSERMTVTAADRTGREHTALIEAQLAVMEEVPYIQKKTSQGLRYTFASEAALIQALRPAMLKHGISVKPCEVREITERAYLSSNDKPMLNRCAVISFLFQHKSGNSEEVEVLAEASDSGDKAAPKLMTIALKYALRQFFLIETGDDPDELVHERAYEEDKKLEERVALAKEKIEEATTPGQLAVVINKLRRLPPAEQVALRELASKRTFEGE